MKGHSPVATLICPQAVHFTLPEAFQLDSCGGLSMTPPLDGMPLKISVAATVLAGVPVKVALSVPKSSSSEDTSSTVPTSVNHRSNHTSYRQYLVPI